MATLYDGLDLANLKLGPAGRVLNITLNRPEILNPLDRATIGELSRVLDILDRDPETEIVVFRGEGRAFSAGGDLKAHLGIHQDPVLMGDMARAVNQTFGRIDASDKLFIAVVDGLCVAGGVELMLRCDVVFASHEAAFGDGHLNVSLLPGAGGTQLIPRMVNPLRAKLFMLTTDFMDGKQAEAVGLVSAAFPRPELEGQVATLLDKLLSKSFGARSAIKYLVNQSMRTGLDAGLAIEQAFVEHFECTHPHAHEGLLAFYEKRKPNFLRRPPRTD